jgi:antirestriction protein ArdC
MSNSVYQYVTDRIIEELQKGNIPWKKSWRGQKAISYVTRKEYKGINLLLLPYAGEYMTFKQVSDLKGTVKKGEHAHMIVYYNWIMKNTGTLDKDGNEKMEKIPVLKYYNVFHISQTEGIESKCEPIVVGNNNTIIEQAEKVVKDYVKREQLKLNIVNGSDEAFYSPLKDEIVMPEITQFSGSNEYYSTLFHEVVHSTGHQRRLDRISKQKSHTFGSEDYSKEELIAEIGASILCNNIGIEIPQTFKNSVAYIQSWLKVLKDDVRLIVVSAGQSHKAVDYIMNVQDGEAVEE